MRPVREHSRSLPLVGPSGEKDSLVCRQGPHVAFHSGEMDVFHLRTWACSLHLVVGEPLTYLAAPTTSLRYVRQHGLHGDTFLCVPAS